VSRVDKSSMTADSMAEEIREFRKSVGLTQAQFATAVGITPTTVYRYEAGTNAPTNDVLAKILQFAVKQQSLKAVQIFGKVLGERSGLLFVDGGGHGDGAESAISNAISKLPLERQLEIMAAVLMIEEGSDSTALRMFRNLIEPWLSRAKQEFGSAIVRSDLAGKGSSIQSRKRQD
jgi:transcriptional regulator with XRE-family HTH domain